MEATGKSAHEKSRGHRRLSSDKNPGTNDGGPLSPKASIGGSGSFLKSFNIPSSGPSSPDDHHHQKPRFPIPIFSSTPLASQNIFNHKRRSSSGVEMLSTKKSDSKKSHSQQSSGSSNTNPEGTLSTVEESQNDSQTSTGGGLLSRWSFRHGRSDTSKNQRTSPTEQLVTVQESTTDDLKTSESTKEEELSRERGNSTDSLHGSDNEDEVGSTSHSELGSPSNRKRNFVTDERELCAMEKNLLTLLEKFQTGKQNAFVQNDTIEKMKSVRTQQEQLAKLHFQLYVEQDRIGNNSTRMPGLSNVSKLTKSLQLLDQSIQDLSWTES